MENCRSSLGFTKASGSSKRLMHAKKGINTKTRKQNKRNLGGNLNVLYEILGKVNNAELLSRITFSKSRKEIPKVLSLLD